jgi:DNA uptake protein ComE-like DNA-binding protein
MVSMRSSEPAAPKPSEPVEATEPEQEEKEAEGDDEEDRGSILGRTVGAILGVGPGREGDEDKDEEAEAKPKDQEEAPKGKPDEEEEAAEPEPEPAVDTGDRTNLNQATFEQLRDVGFSVTQATRVITYRERQQGFKSLDDLADVPGMPRQFLRDVKPKLTL